MPDPLPVRLVLDTNTVMALWVFDDPALARLRGLIDCAAPVLLARADTLEELRRVLAYRQFAVAPERQSTILAAYSARIASIAPDSVSPAPALPTCRDSDDQKFLELARDGRATHLLTRDKALLRLGRHRLTKALFAILTPETFTAALPPL